MRILSVGSLYPPHHSGGYELVWQGAVRHLRRSGHTVRVLASDYREVGIEPAEEDADVHRELRWYWRGHTWPRVGWRAALAIERHNAAVLDRHIAELRPDVVAWWAMGGMSLGLIERVRRADLGAVAFVHDDWLLYGPRADGWLARFASRPRLGPRLARLAERLWGMSAVFDPGASACWVFVSATTRAAAEAVWSLPEATVVHSGVELAQYAPAPPRDWRWRLLYVGRIDPRKGIDTAVDALTQLPGAATLTIVGGGDPSEVARLRRQARDNDVESRVSLVGPQPRSELAHIYAEADAVVFPVRWEEPWGLVPLEAMACGRPVVATGAGGSGEYLHDDENCLLFRRDDAAALASALRRLAGHPDLRERLRAAGLETARGHTAETFHRGVERALTAAIRPRG